MRVGRLYLVESVKQKFSNVFIRFEGCAESDSTGDQIEGVCIECLIDLQFWAAGDEELEAVATMRERSGKSFKNGALSVGGGTLIETINKYEGWTRGCVEIGGGYKYIQGFDEKGHDLTR